MNSFLVYVASLFLFLSWEGDFVDIDQLSRFAIQHSTFIWDSGTEPKTADPGDWFLDWSVSCHPQDSILTYAEANKRKDSKYDLELDHIQSVLKAHRLSPNDFEGSILRARYGYKGGPLFLLFPVAHPLNWMDSSRRVADTNRSFALQLTNVRDFLRLIDIFTKRAQSVSNVSEMMNILLGSNFLKHVRQEISQTMSRENYQSDKDWAYAIGRKGLIDASTFLAFTREESDRLKHLPIESQDSFIRSAILNIILDLRGRRGLKPQQTLYDSFAAEYELGLTYSGIVEHRFSNNSGLQDRFRENWDIFRTYSRLTEEPLLEAALYVCGWRSQNIVTRLIELSTSDLTDYYFVTFGPLHLHGVLEGLEAHNSSYLVITP